MMYAAVFGTAVLLFLGALCECVELTEEQANNVKTKLIEAGCSNTAVTDGDTYETFADCYQDSDSENVKTNDDVYNACKQYFQDSSKNGLEGGCFTLNSPESKSDQNQNKLINCVLAQRNEEGTQENLDKIYMETLAKIQDCTK